MRENIRKYLACMALLLAAALIGFVIHAEAQTASPTPRYFTGLINDYTPQTAGGGPYEIRGTWSLKLNHNGTADFSAAVNMTHDDYWVLANPTTTIGTQSVPTVNNNTSSGRNPHTHHITLTGASVSSNIAGCTGLFVGNGTLSLTGNGNTMFAGSALEVCITGGNAVAYSNITMTFVGPATMHFGTQAIHGVVRKTALDRDHDDHDGDHDSHDGHDGFH